MAHTIQPGGGNSRHAAASRPEPSAGPPAAETRRKAMENHPSNAGIRKLRILVRLDPELASARICVRGMLTPANLYALYCITRRTNFLQPGMLITVDLTGALARAGALDELRASAADGRLPATVDPSGTTCRLTILEPRSTPGGRGD
jgi:hypothetical protein